MAKINYDWKKYASKMKELLEEIRDSDSDKELKENITKAGSLLNEMFFETIKPLTQETPRSILKPKPRKRPKETSL